MYTKNLAYTIFHVLYIEIIYINIVHIVYVYIWKKKEFANFNLILYLQIIKTLRFLINHINTLEITI